MDATFMVDAYPGEKFKGKVRQIRNAAQTVQNVVTYDAVIDVNNLDLKLRPGMTANVNFVFANREDVLRVPNAALRFRPSAELLAALKTPSSGDAMAASNARAESGDRHRPGTSGGSSGGKDEAPNRRSVWVLSGAVPHSTQIKTGTSDGTKTEVVDGALAEGDQVITDGTLTAGAKPPASLLPGAPAPRSGGGPPPF
jgi:HlyD family secretion protein